MEEKALGEYMRDKVLLFIREENMLKPGDRVIAAVSGGADSICLLSVLHAMEPDLPVSLRVLHVNHGLRGAEADRDEELVRQLCLELSVPFFAVHRDVSGYARENKLSEEEAGRILRYQALEQAAEAWDKEAWDKQAGKEARPAWIALAHHRDDQAETIVHHLLRGSGLRGLSGIRPVQGRRIRPLLSVGREEIRAYLRQAGIGWREDSTNSSDAYTRNRIRGSLIPMMEQQVNQRAVDNILRAGELFAQADQYLERQAQKVWQEAGSFDNGRVRLDLRAFLSQEAILRTYLIRRMLDLAAPGQRDLTSRHFAQIQALAEKPTGSRADLPRGLRAEVTYGFLELFLRREENQEGESCLPVLKMAVFPREKAGEIPKNRYTKWFDYDKIRGTLSVRYRESGDYLMLSGEAKKMLTRYMIDEKIPREQRGQIPVLAEGRHILWVLGYRISEYYKIEEDTRTVLQVTMNGGR